MPPQEPAEQGTHAPLAERATSLVVAVGACVVVAMLLYLAGRPLDTNDMWWHLSMGETYSTHGPWPDGDPILFTAHDDAPVQQEWGFSVLTHVFNESGGFTALRIAHVLAVAGILWLVFHLFTCASALTHGRRRRNDARFWAAAGVALYVTLSWWRLFQLRSDLFSIPATFLFAWLVFGPALKQRDDRRFDAARVALAVALVWVWANVHSLFGIALALLIAGLCGALLERILIWLRPLEATAGATEASPFRTRPAEWGVVLGLGALVSAIHPRGFAQIATFFTVSRDFAIWRVRDDWLPFDPFAFDHYSQASMPFVTWVFTDILLVSFLCASAFALHRFLRAPDGRSLARFSPILFGLGLAGCAALMVSIRFIWMAFFPLFYLLRVRALAETGRHDVTQRVVAAAVVVTVAITFPTLGGFARDASDPARYLDRPYAAEGFASESVRMLRDSGANGRVFNAYPLGGFMGYWLRPRLRLFIDSRTEHYPVEIVREYSAANRLRSTQVGETFLGLLDRHGIDFFVGTGLPGPHDLQDWQSFTTQHLDGAPGWVPVFRNFEQQVSMRISKRNRVNLLRVRRFWLDQGVPFEPGPGFDAARVISEAPERAVAWRLVPPSFAHWQRRRSDPDESIRLTAANRVALAFALVGAYAQQIEVEREIIEARPNALPSRRRLVYALLRLGRSAEALVLAGDLAARSNTPRDDRFLEASQQIAALDRQRFPEDLTESARTLREQARYQERQRLLTPLELLTRREIRNQVRSAEGEPMLITGSPATRN